MKNEEILTIDPVDRKILYYEHRGITDMWHSEKLRLWLQESLFLSEIRAHGVSGSSFGLTCAGGEVKKRG
jgi:hypothetical protein